jgi:hypothetical protein
MATSVLQIKGRSQCVKHWLLDHYDEPRKIEKLSYTELNNLYHEGQSKVKTKRFELFKTVILTTVFAVTLFPIIALSFVFAFSTVFLSSVSPFILYPSFITTIGLASLTVKKVSDYVLYIKNLKRDTDDLQDFVYKDLKICKEKEFIKNAGYAINIINFNELPCSEHQTNLIRYLIKTLSEYGGNIVFYPHTMYDLQFNIKPQIADVHPLKFLGIIFSEETPILKKQMQEIFKSTFIKTRFAKDLIKKLERYADVQPLYIYTKDFASTANKNEAVIKDMLTNRKWNELLDYLIFHEYNYTKQ